MSGPPVARWTHVALPAASIDASIAWYELHTPLRLLDRRADDAGESCWLCAPEATDRPFVLVLVSFNAVTGPRPTLAPFAHLGIELPSRLDVDEAAERARAEGCLSWEPQDLPDPVGYVCAVTDPDGNVIEFSHHQGVYDAVRERWGIPS